MRDKRYNSSDGLKKNTTWVSMVWIDSCKQRLRKWESKAQHSRAVIVVLSTTARACCSGQLSVKCRLTDRNPNISEKHGRRVQPQRHPQLLQGNWYRVKDKQHAAVNHSHQVWSGKELTDLNISALYHTAVNEWKLEILYHSSLFFPELQQ